MSVNDCDRDGCKNILCEMLVDGYYVCPECASEFRELIGESAISRGEMKERFRQFLKTTKASREDSEEITVDEFLKDEAGSGDLLP